MIYSGPQPFSSPTTLGDLWDLDPQARAMVEHYETEAAYSAEAATEARRETEAAEDQNYQAQVTIEKIIDLEEQARSERRVTVIREELRLIVENNRFEV